MINIWIIGNLFTSNTKFIITLEVPEIKSSADILNPGSESSADPAEIKSISESPNNQNNVPVAFHENLEFPVYEMKKESNFLLHHFIIKGLFLDNDRKHILRKIS